MKPEIEQIVRADDAARETVDRAQVEATEISAEAQREAERISESNRTRLTEEVAAQVQAVLAEARSKAQAAKMDADGCLARWQSRKLAVMEDLVEALMRKVTGQ